MKIEVMNLQDNNKGGVMGSYGGRRGRRKQVFIISKIKEMIFKIL